MRQEFTPEQIAYFWERVDRSGGPDACWLWTRSTTNYGYGQIMFNRVPMRANRLAWELTNGPIPEGMYCLHHCDVTACCNPAHLYIGTPKQNTRDMMERTGHNRPHAKFTDDQVREIRRRVAAGERKSDLAREYEVWQSVIDRIYKRVSYRHVV